MHTEFVTPAKRTLSRSKLVSSLASRRAQASHASPTSKCPPGSASKPAPWLPFRWPNSTAPRCNGDSIKTPTPTRTTAAAAVDMFVPAVLRSGGPAVLRCLLHEPTSKPTNG